MYNKEKHSKNKQSKDQNERYDESFFYWVLFNFIHLRSAAVVFFRSDEDGEIRILNHCISVHNMGRQLVLYKNE